jgi:serine/threonine-protein kinase
VRAARTQLTRDYTMVGTPEGMSPDRRPPAPMTSTIRTDQWALACLVWRMLSGALPFQGGTLKEPAGQDRSRGFRAALSAAVPGVPAPVEAVLRRALAKQKDDRFPTIGAFARAFETAAMPPAVVAAVPPPVGLAPVPAPMAQGPREYRRPSSPCRGRRRGRWVVALIVLFGWEPGPCWPPAEGGWTGCARVIEQAKK